MRVRENTCAIRFGMPLLTNRVIPQIRQFLDMWDTYAEDMKRTCRGAHAPSRIPLFLSFYRFSLLHFHVKPSRANDKCPDVPCQPSNIGLLWATASRGWFHSRTLDMDEIAALPRNRIVRADVSENALRLKEIRRPAGAARRG
jgi:hypothetical protein